MFTPVIVDTVHIYADVHKGFMDALVKHPSLAWDKYLVTMMNY